MGSVPKQVSAFVIKSPVRASGKAQNVTSAALDGQGNTVKTNALAAAATCATATAIALKGLVVMLPARVQVTGLELNVASVRLTGSVLTALFLAPAGVAMVACATAEENAMPVAAVSVRVMTASALTVTVRSVMHLTTARIVNYVALGSSLSGATTGNPALATVSASMELPKIAMERVFVLKIVGTEPQTVENVVPPVQTTATCSAVVTASAMKALAEMLFVFVRSTGPPRIARCVSPPGLVTNASTTARLTTTHCRFAVLQGYASTIRLPRQHQIPLQLHLRVISPSQWWAARYAIVLRDTSASSVRVPVRGTHLALGTVPAL